MSTRRRELVVVSGAGLSAEGGVPTYRGAGGLWEDTTSTSSRPPTWREDAGTVRRFDNGRRVRLGTVQPNAAHRLLANRRRRFGARLVTHNVDDLLERTSRAEVPHVHGRLTVMRGLACGRTFDIGCGAWSEDERCICLSADEGKPGMVSFGETARGYGRTSRLFRKPTDRDVLAVIGSGSEVVDLGGDGRGHGSGRPLHPFPPTDGPTFSFERAA